MQAGISETESAFFRSRLCGAKQRAATVLILVWDSSSADAKQHRTSRGLIADFALSGIVRER